MERISIQDYRAQYQKSGAGKKKRNNEESQIQQQFIRWVDDFIKVTGHEGLSALYAVPNGGARDEATGATLKREGVRAGVWDIAIDFPARGYAGLRAEFKAGKNSLSADQKKWEKRYKKANYLTVVWYSCAEAIRTIMWYFDLENGNRKSIYGVS